MFCNLTVLSKGVPRPFGTIGIAYTPYSKGSFLEAIERYETEFKGFTSEGNINKLPSRIMATAKNFACGCLNANVEGIIYFGVLNTGEVAGLSLDQHLIDGITSALNTVLNSHIRSDDGILGMDEKKCINLEFVPVTEEGKHQNLYVVEIEISRNFIACGEKIYFPKRWTDKKSITTEGRMRISEYYDMFPNSWEGVILRTNCSTDNVPHVDVNTRAREPLRKMLEDYKRQKMAGIVHYKLKTKFRYKRTSPSHIRHRLISILSKSCKIKP